MILATSHTLTGDPVLIANGSGGPHCAVVRCTSGTDVAIGGSATDCLYPVKTTDAEGVELEINIGEEVWADGTGTVVTLEFELSATPVI